MTMYAQLLIIEYLKEENRILRELLQRLEQLLDRILDLLRQLCLRIGIDYTLKDIDLVLSSLFWGNCSAPPIVEQLTSLGGLAAGPPDPPAPPERA